jgi:hypothetical protein
MVEKNTTAGESEKKTEGKLHFAISGLVAENEGNIKDYYKISSCIGRGKDVK